MTKFRTHYDNLQIARSASLEVIKAAYRTLSAKYHPDRNRGDARSAEIMSIINASYAVLSDEDSRRQHDSWIKRQEAARASRPGPNGFAQPADMDARRPADIPVWSPNATPAARRHWSNVDGTSAAAEAALDQGRTGKFAALFAAALMACLLVLALLSEQKFAGRAGPGPLSSEAASVSGAGSAAQGSGTVVSVPQRLDEDANRAMRIATAFARSETLLRGGPYSARIHDDGEVWLISYRTPAERAAAAPIVLVEKDSLRVLGYYVGGA